MQGAGPTCPLSLSTSVPAAHAGGPAGAEDIYNAPRVSEIVLYSDDRQEDKNGHSYVKLDEDIVKRSCDKVVFKYYSV
ncbi:hypothetical protein G5714_019246 [Onychostoma macrolepis]|uniref:Uncharacterized protein n=1 Tax=Onychostoma macrolepis TaxID=369639 RepID=A0A7J6BVX3_9TELE|nr:hypothetical protein G5714_019246 [Onychostoma macrolepis]